jgi:hypothetical protein
LEYFLPDLVLKTEVVPIQDWRYPKINLTFEFSVNFEIDNCSSTHLHYIRMNYSAPNLAAIVAVVVFDRGSKGPLKGRFFGLGRFERTKVISKVPPNLSLKLTRYFPEPY